MSRNPSGITRAVYLLIAGLSLAPSALRGQITTGNITGTVTDATGASVPSATIKIVDEGTNVERSLVTDSAGIYVGRSLIPGRYRVEVSQAGFQSQAKAGLVLSLDQTIVVNFVLQPGEQKQVVTVVGRGEQLVELASSSLGQTIEESQIRELPLNGRNFQALIGLNTGAQPGPQGSFTQNKFHLNGGRGEGNAFLIDGLDTSSHGNDAIRTFPSLEAIGEFKIITNSFSAEYGRSLSGVISTHIKSGTNELHGTLFHFLRNKVLDARPFFAPSAPKYTWNQFGGSAGTAIIKDKLFIFGDFQGTRIREEALRRYRIPSLAMDGGDFSELLPATVIYDPRTSPRAPFPNNRIPASAVDRPAALMMSLLPAPNTSSSIASGQPNFQKFAGISTTNNAFDIRGDYHINARNRVSAVLTFNNNTGITQDVFQRVSDQLIGGKDFKLQSRTASVNYTRVFGPSTVNELILGWKRDWLVAGNGVGQQYEADLGIPGINTNPKDPFSTGFPLMYPIGYQFFGGPLGVPVSQAHNIPQLSNNFSFNRGKHAFKTGAALRFRQFNIGQAVAPRGWFFFLSLSTASSGFAGGDAMASTLLGYPFQSRRDFGPPWGERLKEYGFYFQDDWKVSRRLTLNLGVRYDLNPPATEAHNRQANYDLRTGTMLLAGENGVSERTIRTHKDNFSPHLGFAYQLSDDGKTVVRGGYSIGYLLLQTAAVGTITERLATNQPFINNYSAQLSFIAPTVRVSDGLPLPSGDPKNPSGSVNFHMDGDPMPYMQQWNFNIQRALPLDFLAELAYAGSRGVHLTGSVNINQAPPGPEPPGPRSVYNPKLNTILGLLNRESSIYHAFQAKLQRRFAQGFYVLGAYTFSKSIDDGSFTANASDASSVQPQDVRNWRAERARSDFDFTHRMIVSYIYELPVGKGRHFLSGMPAAGNFILGGWQINGISTFQSGNVFTPTVANPPTNAGAAGSVRPFRIGSGELSGSAQSINRWFDKSAFVIQGQQGTSPYQFGNSGRNILRGPRLINFDFSVFKEFTVREGMRVELRGEFFDLFNTPHFLLPAAAVDVPTAGIISGTTAPRQVQLGLKLVF